MPDDFKLENPYGIYTTNPRFFFGETVLPEGFVTPNFQPLVGGDVPGRYALTFARENLPDGCAWYDASGKVITDDYVRIPGASIHKIGWVKP